LDPPRPCHRRWSSSSSSLGLSIAPCARASLASSTCRCPRLVTLSAPSLVPSLVLAAWAHRPHHRDHLRLAPPRARPSSSATSSTRTLASS
jgi:hypothetical protein